MMRSTEDPTSIGAILLNMGAVTEEQLEETIEEQQRLREDALLGRLLVARGYCTQDQFDIAMAAQKSMRDGGKASRALAVADISLARSRRKSLLATRKRVIEKGQACVKHITGSQHVAITPTMLASGANGD
jgi:hypothetical protein